MTTKKKICGWQQPTARMLALLSRRAYAEATISVADTDTQVLIVERRDYVVIAFRGTDDLGKFITDAEFYREPLGWTPSCREQLRWSDIQVHAGFLKAFASVREPLIKTLHHRVLNHRALYITGHSLGGALAMLCALELENRFNVHAVYTYGQPRVGNAAFCEFYNHFLGDRTYRHVYENDIVARIPHLPAIFDPYRHAAQEIYLPEFGRIQLNPSRHTLLWNDARNVWRAWVHKHTGMLADALKDHHIDNYIQRL